MNMAPQATDLKGERFETDEPPTHEPADRLVHAVQRDGAGACLCVRDPAWRLLPRAGHAALRRVSRRNTRPRHISKPLPHRTRAGCPGRRDARATAQGLRGRSSALDRLDSSTRISIAIRGGRTCTASLESDTRRSRNSDLPGHRPTPPLENPEPPGSPAHTHASRAACGHGIVAPGFLFRISGHENFIPVSRRFCGCPRDGESVIAHVR